MKQIIKYFREALTETKKVTWPTKQQTYDLTLVVVGVSLAVGFYIGVLDFIFQKLLANIL